ncbi:hypothetical protein VNI00_019324 [Paramarasmius palmivorus]|uniref:Uncharacterized protein n=1 Tax=Paramarasmius palmivorus TaxID=297713 RepID=A0AAW0ANP8_9AGAR
MGGRKRSRKRSQRSSPIRTFTPQDFDDSDDSDHDTKRSKPTAFISSFSNDRRRVVVEPVSLPIDSPVKKTNTPVASSSSKPISSDGFDAFASFSADLLAEQPQGSREGRTATTPESSVFHATKLVVLRYTDVGIVAQCSWFAECIVEQHRRKPLERL